MPVEKKYWEINTEKIAERIRDAAEAAQSEEDLKMKVEPILQHAFSQLGIDVDNVRYEKQIRLRGRADAVYGFLCAEYKAPGKLSTRKGISDVVIQLQGYLEGEAENLRTPKEDYLSKAVGVALDGQSILFIRYSKTAAAVPPPVPISRVQGSLFPEMEVKSGFHVQGPYPISSASVKNLLIYVRASARKPLSASGLAESFGPSSASANQVLANLVGAISGATQGKRKEGRTNVFYREWQRIFGIIYGQDTGSEKATKAAAEVAKDYAMAGISLDHLLFAIHTYYALLMKLLAFELLALQSESNMVSFVQSMAGLDNRKFMERLGALESGEEFAQKGVTNFLEADFFSWYLEEANDKLIESLRIMVREMTQFESATPVLEPEWTRDLLQNLYEKLVNVNLRKVLGEYYTPDWLAQYLIAETGYDGDPNKRFLDPACGSGTFLVQAINLALSRLPWKNEKRLKTEAGKILDNIVGFDINPLAVLAARTNYLIAFSKLLPYVSPVNIPVYLCDSVLMPSRQYDGEGMLPLSEEEIVFHTSREDFVFPALMCEKKWIDAFTEKVELGLKISVKPDKFCPSLMADLGMDESQARLLNRVYEQIKDMHDRGEDGIWARYIKNAFAPVYLDKFNFCVGNPPWIRWGLLSDQYREQTLPLWKRYGLFSLKGHEARLGPGEKDFSMLFTYACADNYLKTGGRLGFVITLEAFKSKGAGEGFRKFVIPEFGGQREIPLKVFAMDDMVHLMPFHAANKTSLFVLEKGRSTRYPINGKIWRRKKGTGKIDPLCPLDRVERLTEIQAIKISPIDQKNQLSSWQSGTINVLKDQKKMKGESAYPAYRGASTEPYGVFWIKSLEKRPDGKIVVFNWHDRGKRVIPAVGPQAIEPELVFPAVSGGGLTKFGHKEIFHVLIPQDPKTRKPFPTDHMLSNYPLTLAYLTQFKKILLSRGSKVIRTLAEDTEFFAMYGIGPYTFAPYRVVWKRMASRMEAAVLAKIKTLAGTKPLIGTDTTSLIAVDNREEAHFICALLNSAAVDAFIRSFSSAGRGFGAPSVIKNIAIPAYDNNNPLHRELSELSLKAHDRVSRDQPIDDLQAKIDQKVKQLWNIKS